MRPILATAGAALALAAAATPAQAAYAPKLKATLDPTTSDAAPAVTSVITQQSGEDPNKTVVVTFPKGFQANVSATASPCNAQQEEAKACPPNSQIGAAEAVASVGGLPQQFTGTVNYGGPISGTKFRIIVFLHNDLLGDQKVIGVAELLNEGGARTTFDNLPNTLTTSFKLALYGGGKSLLKNPVACGDYTITASFTSQKGEQATDSQKVTIDGCKPTPIVLSGVSLSARKVTFDVSVPGRMTVTVKRAKKRVASGSFTLAEAGTAKVKLPKLKRGKYVVAIKVVTDDGRTLSRRFTRNVH